MVLFVRLTVNTILQKRLVDEHFTDAAWVLSVVARVLTPCSCHHWGILLLRISFLLTVYLWQ
jgi:hypothetical protein